MKLLLFVVLACFSLSYQLPADVFCPENKASGRIFGGRCAKQNEFPWMVYLEIETESEEDSVSGCGGTIISTNYVLTAAHCVVYNATLKRYASRKDVTGRIGNIDINHGIPVEFSEIIIHEKYDEDHNADIALLKFKVPLKSYNESVSNICLAKKGKKHANKQPVIQMGWGLFNKDTTSDILKTTDVGYLLDYQNCLKEMHSYPDPGELCVSNAKGEEICEGDSGGPLVIRNGKENLDVGVVSYSHDEVCDGGTYYPSFYTDISHYADWIKNKTKTDRGICWK